MYGIWNLFFKLMRKIVVLRNFIIEIKIKLIWINFSVLYGRIEV